MEETTQAGAAAIHSTGEERFGSAPPRRKLCVMRSGARLFAVYADEVEATSDQLTPTPLPFAPAPVRGVVSQRGRMLTVIDPLLLLQPDAQAAVAPATTPAPLIVALRGDEQLALSIESIAHDIELFDDEAGPETNASHSLFLRRTIQPDTNHIALLDPARLFDAAMQGVERRRRRT